MKKINILAVQFSSRNIVAYYVGILSAFMLSNFALKKHRREHESHFGIVDRW